MNELPPRDVPPNAAAEELSQPLDPDIRMDRQGHYVRFFLPGQENRHACWVTVIDFEQQIGNAVVRMGGIAGLGTDPGVRMQGLARRMMSHALRWMRQDGFDTTMLYGIPRFYPKFGFAPAFPSFSASVALRDAEAVSSAGYRVEAFEPAAHLRSVLRIFQACNAGCTGLTRRWPGWQPFRRGLTWQTQARWTLIVDRRGKPAGYVVYDSADPSTTLLEVGFATPAIFPDVLRFAAGLAMDQRMEAIRLVLRPDHPFLDFCRPLGMTTETQCRRDGGAMIRMINCVTALKRAAPDLEHRAAVRALSGGTPVDTAGGSSASELGRESAVRAPRLQQSVGSRSLSRAWSRDALVAGSRERGKAAGHTRRTCTLSDLTIRTNLDTVGLRWRNGRLTVTDHPVKGPVIALPQWALAQLLYGYRPVGAMAREGIVRGPGAGIALLERMFPVQAHHQPQIDEF